MPAALIIDSPGLTGSEDQTELVAAADDCDMVLWVVAASRAARDIDARALVSVRSHFTGTPNRHRPPMLLILTHIDRLRPFNEWDPPYDLTADARSKALAIRNAMEAAASDLGFAPEEVVPVRADSAARPYNIDALWAKLIELVPEAQRARLLRVLADVKSASGWATIWSQAANAGRVVKGTFLGRGTTP